MVIYEREKKTLIIPTGIGNVSYGGESYEQGVSDGKTAQEAADRAKLTTRNITANGSYEAPYGYSRVNVNVPTSVSGDCSQAIATAYASGITEGRQEQKNLMTTTAITENGTYERADGWSSISVSVHSSECNLGRDALGINAAWNGHTFLYPSAIGKDGFSEVEIYDNGYGQRKYSNGVADGKAQQKALLGSQSFSANGTYTTTGDGWSSVTIGVYSEDCQDAYDNGYSNGYADGQIDSKDDMTEITPASSVTLTEYGTYYFTYDENTDIQSMLVNFAHTQPQPPHSGSTSGYAGYVRIYPIGDADVEDFPLYNLDADDSTLSSIKINDEEYSGGSIYTGNIHKIQYNFEGQIPDNFWSGWSAGEKKLLVFMYVKNMLVGKNAFRNTNLTEVVIYADNECIIDEGAFVDTNIRFMHLLQYHSGGSFTFMHNSFKDNPNFRQLRLYMNSVNVFNADSSVFANSMADGTAIIDSRVPLNDIYATQWWSTLENQGWTAENS